jgi:hypothetical protein
LLEAAEVEKLKVRLKTMVAEAAEQVEFYLYKTYLTQTLHLKV